MLVLARKTGERVVFSDADGKHIATITLVEVRSMNGVRLGIDAGPDINVDREEVYEAKKAFRPSRQALQS